MVDSDNDILDLNFWPSFADLMLILVFIFVSILFISIKIINSKSIDISQTQQKQNQLIFDLSHEFNSSIRKSVQDTNRLSIPIKGDSIFIQNDLKLQTITFSDQLLFDEGEFYIKPRGFDILEVVGNVIKKNIPSIIEIQIQGHADNIPVSHKKISNLHLAANRAIEVFNYLTSYIKIDPTEHLISATSFGEFKPVGRVAQDSTYNLEKLSDDNNEEYKRDRNRRIEMLLFYK